MMGLFPGGIIQVTALNSWAEECGKRFEIRVSVAEDGSSIWSDFNFGELTRIRNGRRQIRFLLEVIALAERQKKAAERESGRSN